jgi:hypothetical protein
MVHPDGEPDSGVTGAILKISKKPKPKKKKTVIILKGSK